jgi:hypothetical protein
MIHINDLNAPFKPLVGMEESTSLTVRVSYMKENQMISNLMLISSSIIVFIIAVFADVWEMNYYGYFTGLGFLIYLVIIQVYVYQTAHRSIYRMILSQFEFYYMVLIISLDFNIILINTMLNRDFYIKYNSDYFRLCTGCILYTIVNFDLLMTDATPHISKTIKMFMFVLMMTYTIIEALFIIINNRPETILCILKCTPLNSLSITIKFNLIIFYFKYSSMLYLHPESFIIIKSSINCIITYEIDDDAL